ncbi:Caprin-1 [Exaiptasia diaphana]|nr:Caprin-1 [Exaiptasia diaphana]
METSDASKTALLLVEKKVRNLEKRKMKLDGYKKMMDGGQELNEDQKKAIANLASVEMSLEMTKDLHKQFQQLHIETQKQLKKQARREQVASQAAQHNADVAKVCQVLELQSLMDNLSEDVRADFLNGTNGAVTQKQLKKQARREQVASQAAQHNADVAKVCQVLELQSLMDNLSEDVRADFLNGTNGAVTVKEEEFAHIDDFYKLITPDSESDINMQKQIKDASEHIINLLNSSPTEVADTTCILTIIWYIFFKTIFSVVNFENSVAN